MINRKHRFHGRGSLSYLYKNGRSVRTDFLTLKYTASRQQDYRLAVVVSKKVSKKAVVRNRIRRRIYEVIRNARKNSSSTWGFDMSIMVYDESLAKISYDELCELLNGLLKKAKII